MVLLKLQNLKYSNYLNNNAEYYILNKKFIFKLYSIENNYLKFFYNLIEIISQFFEEKALG